MRDADFTQLLRAAAERMFGPIQWDQDGGLFGHCLCPGREKHLQVETPKDTLASFDPANPFYCCTHDDLCRNEVLIAEDRWRRTVQFLKSHIVAVEQTCGVELKIAGVKNEARTSANR